MATDSTAGGVNPAQGVSVGETARVHGPSKAHRVDDGERAAFDALYREHFASICQVATLMIGNAQDGQDIAQEAFAKWYVRRASVDNHEAYLRTIVINLVRGRLRRLGVSRRFASVLETEARDVNVDPPDMLADVIAKLPERQRAAVILRYYEGRTEGEIAQILQCRPGTVKSLLSRARHEMRRVIEH
jgi:RNA polymerase sigma factor (sigma-70 family)